MGGKLPPAGSRAAMDETARGDVLRPPGRQDDLLRFRRRRAETRIPAAAGGRDPSGRIVLHKPRHARPAHRPCPAALPTIRACSTPSSRPCWPAASPSVVLVVNHVLAAEPQAMARLRAARRPPRRAAPRRLAALLPALPALRFAVTPAGLLEWCGDAARAPGRPGDLRLDRRRNPAAALRAGPGRARGRASRSTATRSSPPTSNWLVDHVRWDVEDDLARVVGAGAGARARPGRRRARTAACAAPAGAMRGCPAQRRAPPRRRDTGDRDEAFHAPRLHRADRSALRARRAGAVELPPAPACGGWCACITVGRRLRRAARPAPAPGAGAPGADLRQVRPGAVDPARPAAARHRRRAGAAAGPGAAVPVRPSRIATDRARLRPADRRRSSRSFDAEPVASASIAQVHFATLRTDGARGGGQGAAPRHAARSSRTTWR